MRGTSWYVFLGCGSSPRPPKGPWTSQELARSALNRWRERIGFSVADRLLTVSSTILAGPYATRAAARAADISDPGKVGSWSWATFA